MTAFCGRVGVDANVLQQAVARVTRRYGTDDPMEPLDTPLVSEQAWTRQVEQVLADECGREIRLGDFGALWFDGRPANAEWLEWLRVLKSHGISIGLLSNMPPSWDGHWRRMVRPEFFDHIVLSFQVGFRKPMREIFDRSARLAGVQPRQCLLVDDAARNCAGARRAGWQAIEFGETPMAISGMSKWLGIEPLERKAIPR